jgi:hypothetical protein
VSPQGEVILTSQLPDLPSPIPTRSKMGRLNIGEHSHLPLVATRHFCRKDATDGI